MEHLCYNHCDNYDAMKMLSKKGTHKWVTGEATEVNLTATFMVKLPNFYGSHHH